MTPVEPAEGPGPGLAIRDLAVSVGGKPVLRGITLAVRPGERHALLGPAGAGKSTLARAIMGDPLCEVTAGEIRLDGEDLRPLGPAARARRGLFLAFQEPAEVPGVTNASFLRQALSAVRGAPVGVFELQGELKTALERLGADPRLAKKMVNEGLSPAERKRNEILQLVLLRPRVAVLDDPEGPLDAIAELAPKDMALLLLGRDARILGYTPIAFVHMMENGKIVRSERHEDRIAS